MKEFHRKISSVYLCVPSVSLCVMLHSDFSPFYHRCLVISEMGSSQKLPRKGYLKYLILGDLAALRENF